MRLLNNNVALRQILRNEKASESSTLYVPETTRAKSNEAVVKAVGPGEFQNGYIVPIALQPGDRVLFQRFGYEAMLNGEVVFIVTDRDIFAVLDDDDVAEFAGATIDAAERQELLGKGF